MKNRQAQVEDALLDRRTFISSGIAVAGGLALWSGGLARAQSPVSAEQKTSGTGGSRKAWAQKNLRGGEAFVLPSVKQDLKTLDVEGVRRDVRHAIAQGFCSVMPMPIGIDRDAINLMYQTVADEAKGKILTVSLILPGKWEDMEKRVRYQEGLGYSHAMMYFNPKLASQEAIYEQMRSIAEKTSMGIILYAKPENAIQSMDPTGLPMDAFDKLADLDNVIGLKITQTIRPSAAYALAKRLGDRLLLGPVNLECMLLMSLKYKMQWTGQWAIDSLQSPEQPWVSQFLALLAEGKDTEAYKLYWRYEPIASFFYALQEPCLKAGGHPWAHIKYMKWLTGGNGGLVPDLKSPAEKVPPLDAAGRAKCRDIFKQVGIKTVDLPDEAFVVGNAAYEKGVRLKDMKATPQYVV
jgi:4-hydroxy-tetrahydrodipicolinate synthase